MAGAGGPESAQTDALIIKYMTAKQSFSLFQFSENLLCCADWYIPKVIMHKTLIRQSSNGYLVAGVLVLLLAAVLFFLLWRSINAPFFWIALTGWLVLPLIPFAMGFLAQRPKSRTDKGLC